MQKWTYFSMGVMAGLILLLGGALLMQGREQTAYAMQGVDNQGKYAMAVGSSEANKYDMLWVLNEHPPHPKLKLLRYKGGVYESRRDLDPTAVQAALATHRGAVLSAKQNRYVEAAQAIGCRHPRIILSHILPNVTAPILIIASIWLGNAILIEATLSFLGVGTQPPTPSWGLMLASTGRAFMEQAPWLAIFPGFAISLAVLAFNLFGDTLRDAWDPKLKG